MEWFQLSVFDARWVPAMVTQELGTMPGWKLAPLTTPLSEMEGGGGEWSPPAPQSRDRDLVSLAIARHAAGRALGNLARIERARRRQ